MPVARQDHGIVDALGGKKIVEALPLARKITPFLVPVRIGDKLDRADDQAHIGLFVEFAFQPFPLRLSEQRGRDIVARDVIAKRTQCVGPGQAPQFTAKKARAEQDDLDALATGSDDDAVLHSRAAAHRGLTSPVGFVDAFGAFLEGEACAGIVLPEIMVVPGRKHRTLARKARNSSWLDKRRYAAVKVGMRASPTWPVSP